MQSEEELATLRGMNVAHMFSTSKFLIHRDATAIFDRFDADDSGQVSTAEFETILEALGRDPSDGRCTECQVSTPSEWSRSVAYPERCRPRPKRFALVRGVRRCNPIR